LEFLVSVAAVHVVALGLYYALHLPQAPAGEQRMFAWVWMGVTVLVVLVGLQRIKRARNARRDQVLRSEL
jgi:heme/copper-type cytochrome/quinol oxidase subunit 4